MKMISNKIFNKFKLLLIVVLSLFVLTNVDAQIRKSKSVTVVKVEKTPRSKVVYLNKNRRVRTVTTLPRRAKVVRYNGIAFHYYDGVFYQKRSGTVAIVNAPRGIKVSHIPGNYRRIAINGMNYFYVNGLFYKKQGNYYEIVSPQVGLLVQNLPDGAEKISIDSVIYYEYADTFYRLVETENGLAYKVMGVIG